MRFNTNIQQGASVRYTLQILERGKIVRTIPTKKNLILDQGLDGIASRAWVTAFEYAAVGTGTEPTRRDTGAVTVSRAGSTLTASAGFFIASDAGRLFKFDSGEEVRITAYTSATEVTTADSGAIAADAGTVWYVNQTALQTESKRTNTYGTDSGDNGTTFLTDTLTFKRSFIFSAEVGTVTYREIGWSHTGAAGANLFGRDLLAGSGVTLVAGQQLKAICELSVKLSPASSTAFVNPISGGFGDNGFYGCEFASLGRVSAGGGSDLDEQKISLEPSTPLVGKAWTLTTNSGAIGAMNGNGLATAVAVKILAAAGSYASGTFTKTYTGKAAISELNAANWRSICFGSRHGSTNQTYAAMRILMNTNQTKLSTHTLELTFRISWGRILTN